MWIIFDPPNKLENFLLLAVHAETFVELVIVKRNPADKTFEVVIQKPFDAHGSNQSTLHHILGIFDTDGKALEFALDLLEAIKKGEPCFETQDPFLPKTDDNKNKVDKAYL